MLYKMIELCSNTKVQAVQVHCNFLTFPNYWNHYLHPHPLSDLVEKIQEYCHDCQKDPQGTQQDRNISFRNRFSMTGHLIEVIPRKVV